jgi:predicted amidohydrolase
MLSAPVEALRLAISGHLVNDKRVGNLGTHAPSRLVLLVGTNAKKETSMKFKVACIQTNPQTDVLANLREVAARVAEAAREGARVVVLPEMFTYMGSEQGRLASADALGEGVFARLAELARTNGVCLVAGSHAEKANTPGKVFNTAVTYSPQGDVVSAYRKIHLFNLRDGGGKPLYCESDVFARGDSIEGFALSVEGVGARALTAVCYDLRFPEIFRDAGGRLKKERFDVVFLPAAFTHQTGQDHWEVLLRARAIENQCWFVACNQTGFHSEGRKRNYGNSLVVDPWGRVTARLGEEAGILMTEIDLALVQDARTRLPALADRVF